MSRLALESSHACATRQPVIVAAAESRWANAVAASIREAGRIAAVVSLPEVWPTPAPPSDARVNFVVKLPRYFEKNRITRRLLSIKERFRGGFVRFLAVGTTSGRPRIGMNLNSPNFQFYLMDPGDPLFLKRILDALLPEHPATGDAVAVPGGESSGADVPSHMSNDSPVCESSLERGILLWEQRDVWGALEQFRTAVAERPRDADTHYWLGRSLFDWGDLDGARRKLVKAIALRDNYADAYEVLGIIYRLSGRVDRSARCFRNAATAEPGNPNHWLLLAVSLRGLGRYDEYIAALREALRLDPGLGTARAMLESAAPGR